MNQNKKVEVIVYGAEQLCASCVHLPSSKDTFEWLQAAISRKFSNQAITFSYVDIYSPPQVAVIREYAKKIIEEDMFYPVVIINGEVVCEGNPSLKSIFLALKNVGCKEV